MLADMPIEPFETFPEEFHIRGETHVAFIVCGIGHVNVKVLKIWFPVGGQHFLEEFNVMTGCYLITNGTDYFGVGYGSKDRIYHDSAKHLVVYVAVDMFHQLSVKKSGVGFQDHKAIFAKGLKIFLRSRRCSDKHMVFAIRSNGKIE